MKRKPSKKIELIKRIAVYVAMTLSVLIIVSGLILILLGYRFDTDNGRVEQGGLVQFATIPTGATVEVDGKVISSRTPTKSSVIAGSHEFVMWREGYQTWRKTVNVEAGTLLWLTYPRLVPTIKTVVPVAQYGALHASLATADGQDMLIQTDAAIPSFELVDLRADEVKSTIITIPATAYSDATTPDVSHTFTLDQWDADGRYVLVQHRYGDTSEWLVVDSQDVTKTINMTTLFDIDISSPKFSGTSGNMLYVMSGSDIRKLDLSAGTISRSLVAGVTSFDLFETNVVTYVGVDQTDATKRVVGLYREGDNIPHVLRSVASADDVPLHISTARYFNQDYVAIAEGNTVDIMSGSYPASDDLESDSLRAYGSFSTKSAIDHLFFSPAGEYVMAQSDASFSTFDIEHKLMSTSAIASDVTEAIRPLQWLDDNYVWSDYAGNVSLREFDGGNGGTINPVIVGQDVTLSQSGRYLYSMGKNDTGFQLQRVRMILQ